MSGTERLLERLSDGRFHSHESLYRDLGVMVHSRVADLRKKGHVIHTRRQWDKHQRRNFWYYRLAPLSEPSVLPGEGVVASPIGAETATDGSLSGARTTRDSVESVLLPVEPVSSLSPEDESRMTPAHTAAAAAPPETTPLSLFDVPSTPAWA